MKKLWAGVKGFFSKAWPTLLKVFAVLGLILTGKYFIEKAFISPVTDRKNWIKIDDKTISIINESGEVIKNVTMPKDNETGKTMKIEDIEAVGITEGGKAYVSKKKRVSNNADNANDNPYDPC